MSEVVHCDAEGSSRQPCRRQRPSGVGIEVTTFQATSDSHDCARDSEHLEFRQVHMVRITLMLAAQLHTHLLIYLLIAESAGT